MTKTKTTFVFEKEYWDKGYQYVAGLDEVGRGAFAGPVVVGSVVFPSTIKFNKDLRQITDSKLLSPEKRRHLSEKIKSVALCYSIAEISVEIINQYGIGKATQMGFSQAVNLLPTSPDFLLIDAFYINTIDKGMQKPIIHGDLHSYSIAAASILAKVHRDAHMESFKEDMYFFAKHKGYGTALHRQKIKEFGLSAQHRASFNLTKYAPDNTIRP